jgi:SAM-dependent methyltransferase
LSIETEHAERLQTDRRQKELIAMPMTQQDIRRHYEQEWKQKSARAADISTLAYSSPLQDAVVYPIYQELVRDLKIRVNGGRVLDVGCGSGRWVRYFLEWFKPRRVLGIDIVQASIGLLEKWHEPRPDVAVTFRRADITEPALDLGERFDLINVANVLFHIPEEDLFAQALRNLRVHLAPDGRIVTTEYMPRITMRTNFMLVRSRYHFEQAIRAAGLRIVTIRGFGIFANDPMGIDGPDDGLRAQFNEIRTRTKQLFSSNLDDATRNFFVDYLAGIERALLAFCRERIADVDLPSQKLVVLAPAADA